MRINEQGHNRTEELHWMQKNMDGSSTRRRNFDS